MFGADEQVPGRRQSDKEPKRCPLCIPGVYEKAVQDFTETARRLARLNQHFRQASFAKFEMLMVDDGVLKRYGLPKPMVERALIEVYETVVLGYRDHIDGDAATTKTIRVVTVR
jgi:hypothetical protein